MNHLTIQKLISSITQEPGPLIRLRRMEDETRVSLKMRKKIKSAKSSSRHKTKCTDNGKENIHFEDNAGQQDKCCMCGVFKSSNNMTKDVLEFELLFTYFPSECPQLCHIAQYCGNCHSLLTRLRGLHASLIKVKEDLEDFVSVIKIAFQLNDHDTSTYCKPQGTKENETISCKLEIESPEGSEVGTLIGFETNSIESEVEMDEKPFIIEHCEDLDVPPLDENDMDDFPSSSPVSAENGTPDHDVNDEPPTLIETSLENPFGEKRGLMNDEKALGSNFRITSAFNIMPSEQTDITEEYKCNSCGKAFGRLAKLKSHELVAHRTEGIDEDDKEGPRIRNRGSDNSPPQSDYLESDTDSEEYKTDEEDLHDGNSEVDNDLDTNKKTENYLFTCHICRENFEMGHRYEKHYKSLHPGERFHCLLSKCRQSYAHLRDLRRHRKRVHDVETVRPTSSVGPRNALSRNAPSRLTCANCQKAFEGWKALRQHFKEQHSQTSDESGSARLVYKCPNCLLFSLEYDAVSKHLLTEHQHMNLRVQALLPLAAHEQFLKPPKRRDSLAVVLEQKISPERAIQENPVLKETDPDNQETTEIPYEATAYNGNHLNKLQEAQNHDKVGNDNPVGCPEEEADGSPEMTNSLEKQCEKPCNNENEQNPPTSENVNDEDDSLEKESVINTDLIQTKPSSNIQNCRLCDLECLTPRTLVTHFQLSHPGQQPFSCFCGQFFHTKLNKRDHERRIHKQEGDFVCEACGQSFYRKPAFEAHVKQHNEKPQNCPDCQETLPTRAELEEHHRVVHRGQKPRPHVCSKCPAYFEKERALRDHKTKCHPHGDWKPKKCDTCGKRFRFRIRYETHIHKEGGKIAYRCLDCGKQVGKPELMERHIARHHEGKPIKVKKKRTQCALCGLILVKDHLKGHMERAHAENPKERKFCSECNESFPSFTAKEKHDREVHRGLNLLRCYFCSKTFATNCFLEHHVNTHTKEGLDCRVCGKVFANSHTLEGHMTTVCGEDPVKKAKRLKINREKMAQFRANKPYKCGKCGAGFPQKPGLTSHERKCNAALNC